MIDPARRGVAVFENELTRALGSDDTLTGDVVASGFACNIDELFEGLAPMRAD